MAHFPNGKREGITLERVEFQELLCDIKASNTRLKGKRMEFLGNQITYKKKFSHLTFSIIQNLLKN